MAWELLLGELGMILGDNLTILKCHVPFHVKAQMVRPRKGSFAKSALKRPISRVFSRVSRQFV